jgi:prolyl-tRNA synthetase
MVKRQAGTSFFRSELCKSIRREVLMQGKQEYVWGPHGVSTRLMGALVMTHSDDQGLFYPNLRLYKW